MSENVPFKRWWGGTWRARRGRSIDTIENLWRYCIAELWCENYFYLMKKFCFCFFECFFFQVAMGLPRWAHSSQDPCGPDKRRRKKPKSNAQRSKARREKNRTVFKRRPMTCKERKQRQRHGAPDVDLGSRATSQSSERSSSKSGTRYRRALSTATLLRTARDFESVFGAKERRLRRIN